MLGNTSMHTASYYIVNAITFYRIITAPLLIFLVITDRPDLFKWLLALSFFTDAIDGYIARWFRVSSILGAKLDSIGDDLTVLAGVIGMVVFKPEFFRDQALYLILLFVLFTIQAGLAYYRYGKLTSFHTYVAKLAAVLQGVFLILLFFLPEPLYFLFYAALIVTALEILEEILLVIILPKWEANVKGLYWVNRRKN